MERTKRSEVPALPGRFLLACSVMSQCDEEVRRKARPEDGVDDDREKPGPLSPDDTRVVLQVLTLELLMRPAAEEARAKLVGLLGVGRVGGKVK